MKVLTSADCTQNLPWSELLYSATAERKGIKNVPSPFERERLRQWGGAIFQPTRDHFGVPIHVSSGFRCKKLNTAITGRITDSQHQRGEAGDLDQGEAIHGVTNRDVFYFALHNLPFDQMIWEFGTDAEPDWVHISYAAGRKGRREVRRAIRDPKTGDVSYPLFPVR